MHRRKKLEFCVNTAIKKFPYFSVRLCTDGLTLFFEHNDNPVPVFSVESSNRQFGSDAVNRHYMFFTVKDEWLVFDISHILTDGCGAKRFLKAVLFLYCKAVYNENLSWSGSDLFQKSVLNPLLINPLEKFDTTQKYDFNNYYSASPVQITNMMKLNANPTLFRLKIKESELIRFIKNNDGTPNVLFSLLLNKAINKILSHSNGIRSLICVNSRKYLNAPTAHQNLVSSAMLPYFKSYEKLPIEKQLSMLKGLLKFYCLEEIQKNKISDHIYKQKIISQGLTLFDKYKIYANIPVNNDDLATNTVSYIKNEGWGCLSKYITDISIELRFRKKKSKFAEI